MLKRTALYMIIFACVLILGACGNSNEGASSSDERPGLPIARMIEVDLNLPETAEVGEEVIIEATVTLDNEPVEDADEVVFEVWQRDQKDDGQHIDGEHQGDGVYSISLSFDEDDLYYVISHVTVEEMHNMPQKRIAVGDVPDEILNEEDPEHDPHGDMHNH